MTILTTRTSTGAARLNARLSARIATGAVAAVAATTVLAPGGAWAVTPVTADDLPTSAQFQKVFPAYKEGLIATTPQRALVSPLGRKDCRNGSKKFRAKSGITGQYDASKQRQSSSVSVLRFSKKSTAKDAIARQQRYLKYCLSPGPVASETRVKLPRIGDETAASRITFFDDENSGANTYGATVWVRKGRTIVVVGVLTKKKVSKEKIAAIARVSLKRAL